MENNIFDKVLDNIDIVDVISKFVTLEPKGKNYFGVCPFHNDTNPSMSVTRDYGRNGIFQCWVCKIKGNAISFVEKSKNISYIEATKYLANEYHIDVSEFSNSKYDKYDKYYELMKTSSKFYAFLMNDENFSREAREYLNKRGITDDTIRDFEIGLSSGDKSALSETLLKKKYILPDIEINGLTTTKNDEYFDTFNERIMVPIRDEQGRVVAFGGRIYKESSKGQNKYQNSNNTPIFKKGELVFNLDRASNELKEKNYLILNEGYMDVIQAYSNGIRNSIALMGTAITDEQASLIAKYTKNVAICLDGDEPGVRAVKAVIQRLESKNINCSITILKDGLDPDEYIRKYSKDAYLKEIEENRIDKIGYLYELTKLDYKEINNFNVESFEKAMFENIKHERSGATIERYLKRIANEIHVSYESILQDYNDYTRVLNNVPNLIERDIVEPQNNFKIESKRNKAEKMLVDYALENYKYYREIEIKMDSRVFMKNEFYKSLFIEIGDIYDVNPNINKNDLIHKLKERDTYKDFNHDSKMDFSMKDLKSSLLVSMEKEDIKESIEYYTLKLRDLSLTTEKRNLYLTKIFNLKKELHNLK